MKIYKILVFQVILLFFLFSCRVEEISNEIATPSQIIHEYTKNDGPDKNPMKGWNSGWWTEDNLATVAMQYVSWKKLEPVDDQFDFEAVEEIINRPGSRNKHFILRLYTDWNGEQPVSDGGPSWLFNDLGVDRLQGPNGRYITDYNNQNYINEAIEAIRALAAHYDNDPRAFAFQIGVFGYWGEWHTHGFNGTFSISDATRNQILNAYKENFSNAKIMGRYPFREPLRSTGGIGFHNDFFGPSGHSNDFDVAIHELSKFLDGPMGGEAPPTLSDEDFGIMLSTGSGMDMIKKGHYTVMKAKNRVNECDSSPNGAKCRGYMSINRKMGYNYQIETAAFPEVLSQNDNLAVDLLLSNIGVAPMYFKWDVQFSLINQNQEIVKTFDSDYDLTSLLPGEQYNIKASSLVSDVPKGIYKLGIRVIQPGADDSKAEKWKLDARNTYILFSNEMDEVEGVWNSANALSGGWSILGEIIVKL